MLPGGPSRPRKSAVVQARAGPAKPARYARFMTRKLAHVRIAPSTLRAVAAVLFLALLPAGAMAQASKPKPIADPEVIDVQGFQDLLARYRGRPVMVNFWATWCQPCHEEFPMVVALARQYAPQGLVVIGISLDEDAEINLMRHFLARNRPGFLNYRKQPGNEAAFSHAVHLKWTGAIPATFFYGRDGRAAASLIGEHKRPDFEKAIRALLEPEAKSSDQPRPKASSPGP